MEMKEMEPQTEWGVKEKKVHLFEYSFHVFQDLPDTRTRNHEM